MVVSHDQHFITHTNQEMWVVGGGKVNGWVPWRLQRLHKKETLQRTDKRVTDSVKSLSNCNK